MSIRWDQRHTGVLKAETLPAAERQRDATSEESLAMDGLEFEEGVTSQELWSLWKLEKKAPMEPALRHLALAQGDHIGLLPSSLHSTHRICTHRTRCF